MLQSLDAGFIVYGVTCPAIELAISGNRADNIPIARFANVFVKFYNVKYTELLAIVQFLRWVFCVRLGMLTVPHHLMLLLFWK